MPGENENSVCHHVFPRSGVIAWRGGAVLSCDEGDVGQPIRKRTGHVFGKGYCKLACLS